MLRIRQRMVPEVIVRWLSRGHRGLVITHGINKDVIAMSLNGSDITPSNSFGFLCFFKLFYDDDCQNHIK